MTALLSAGMVQVCRQVNHLHTYPDLAQLSMASEYHSWSVNRHTLQCWLVEQGLTSHSTQFRSFRRQCFHRSDDPPNQQCQSTEGGWLVIQIALNLTRLISPCYNNTTCMHIQDNENAKKSKHSEWTRCTSPSMVLQCKLVCNGWRLKKDQSHPMSVWLWLLTKFQLLTNVVPNNGC